MVVFHYSTIKIRRAPTRHDNIDFGPIITKTSEILPLSVVTADKAYDSEENHVLVRELLHGYSIIPTRYETSKWEGTKELIKELVYNHGTKIRVLTPFSECAASIHGRQ